MAIRLYTDEDVHYDLSTALRSLGHDADSFKDHATFGWTDARQLAIAVDLGRSIVTSNRKDFYLLHEALNLWHSRWRVQSPIRHYGVLIVPHLRLTDLIRIVDEFARQFGSVDNRLFLWSSEKGWHEPV